jgi:hypothetical protein
LLLRRLVAAGEKDDQYARTLCVIHPVPGAEINLQLANTISQNSMMSGVSMHQPIYANLDSSATGTVFE